MISNSENALLQSILDNAVFYSSGSFESDEGFIQVSDWLLEVGSLTQRFEALSSKVYVHPHVEQFIEFDCSKHSFCHLDETSIWQRDITLYADEEPWLVARSLIPKSMLLDNHQQLIDLGTKPLGKYLFLHPNLMRTSFEVSKVVISNSFLPISLKKKIILSPKHEYILWARRSLLTIDQFSLQLTELFLPKSPILIK